MTSADPVTEITGLFASEGAADYLGEPVTRAAHMLHAAQLAERDGGGDALIAAALLHDVGHFTGAISGQQLMEGTDNQHSHTGADWLAEWFGPGVTEPTELAAFAMSPYAEAACRLRRWDDAAKDPEVTTPPLEHYRPLLSQLLRSAG
jgi:gamma-butyrobetaine dioxygenase